MRRIYRRVALGKLSLETIIALCVVLLHALFVNEILRMRGRASPTAAANALARSALALSERKSTLYT